MFRRALFRQRESASVAAAVSGSGCGGAAASDDASVSFTSSLRGATRSVTTMGQFNPIHDFSYGISKGVSAKDRDAFLQLIRNPGPLQVSYSPDYLDWLHRAYGAKVKYEHAKSVSENKFNGNMVTGNGKSRKRDAPETSATPPGMFLRPQHSYYRAVGETARRNAQLTIDDAAKQQGLLDLFERQPQFPAIHIERCTRFHILELFKELILNRALSATEIWEKALLYRAVLQERKLSYPSSFGYIFRSVDEVVLARRKPVDPSDPKSELRLESADKFPSEDAFLYFLYLTKKYFVQNAVEAHVVHRCHRHPKSAEILFCQPPPKDDIELQKAMREYMKASGSASAGGARQVDGGADSGNAAPAKEAATASYMHAPEPSSYPPISALWRNEENEPLLRVLLFGELNLIVSDNPFIKFPDAHAHLTRPYASDSSRGGSQQAAVGDRNRQRSDMEGVGLASIIAENRGTTMAPIARNVIMALDGRANDLRRMQQRHHMDDIAGAQKMRRGPDADESPALYSSYADVSYFNPRAVRAEERDAITQRAVSAIKGYDAATRQIYRGGYEDVRSSNAERVTETKHHIPPTIPSVPHFVAQIQKDPHVSFLSHVWLNDHAELERLTIHLANALFQMATTYHKEASRRINRQKVNIAAALLDNYVETQWKLMLEQSSTGASSHATEEIPGSLSEVDDVASRARRVGEYVPFAGKMIDECGFPTDARFDDYMRWMAPPK